MLPGNYMNYQYVQQHGWISKALCYVGGKKNGKDNMMYDSIYMKF